MPLSRDAVPRAFRSRRLSLLIFAVASFNADVAIAQSIYDQLILPRPSRITEPQVYAAIDPQTGMEMLATEPTPFYNEIPINANFLGRAAIIGDNTRLADFSNGNFVPSAIPVDGQPFFGSDSRANLQGNGSAIALDAYAPASFGMDASVHAQIAIDNASISATDSSGGVDFSVRQVYARLNRLKVGVMDTAFGDPSAVPEILDLAGPSARVTTYDSGFGGDGQGRLSYDLLSDEPEGFEIIASVEQSIAEIAPADDEDLTFSHTPDFVLASQYVDGVYVGDDFYENWHLQFSSVFRDLSIESPSGDSQSDFGWGTSLSGAYRLRLYDDGTPLDRAAFSVTYGQGISHYITDLNAADDTGDAVINDGGSLEALPVLAWYSAYTHSWNNVLRSTISYSRVELQSVDRLGVVASPYRTGDWAAINLVHHRVFNGPIDADTPKRTLYTGLEYLYGMKETLDGAEGAADRLMFVVVISK